MRLLFFIALTLCLNPVYAQEKDKIWFEGEVELMDGTKLKGSINYNLRYQLIRLRTGNQTKVIAERDLARMIIVAESSRHEFLQLALKDSEGNVRLKFAEILYKSDEYFSLFRGYTALTEMRYFDDLTYLAIVEEIPADINRDAFHPKPKGFSNVVNSLFLANYEGENYNISKKEVLKAHRPWSKQLRHYAKRNHLNFRNVNHLISILRYAESLAKNAQSD